MFLSLVPTGAARLADGAAGRGEATSALRATAGDHAVVERGPIGTDTVVM